MDMRGGDFFDALIGALDHILKEGDIVARILFLDADDATLVRRYKETRRAHPLAVNGLPLDGIKQERELLSVVKGRANFVYNTSNMKPKQLREKIVKEFASEADTIFTVNIMSFGFKHGMPIDADLVFDVRFLKNPYYVEELRPKTGLQTEVSSYVLALEDTQILIQKLTDLLDFMIPLYRQEGKSQLVIAFGCTDSEEDGTWMVYTHGGRNKTSWSAIEWAKEAVRLGAGEILLTSMNQDGEKSGFDLALTKAVREAVTVPVIASGGAGHAEHFYEVLAHEVDADAALAASMCIINRIISI